MYNGYLIKVGGAILPMQYIEAQKYNITPNARQDLESFRNALGELERNVVDHMISKIEIGTLQLTNTDLGNLWGVIRSNWMNEKERKVNLEYYNPEKDGYDSGIFYIPDIQYPINRIENGVIYYDSFTLKFIEY